MAYKANLNGLVLSIDRQNGSLIELSYPATGVILEAPPKSAGLLDVAYPIPAFPAMRLASRFSRASITQMSNGLMIAYTSLGPSRANIPLPSGKVSAEIFIRAADDGRSVIFSCRIENHSTVAIPQILFPDFWGLAPFAGLRRTQLRLARADIFPFMVPFQAQGAAPLFTYRVGWKEYSPLSGYYSENALRWLDYGSLKGGLSIFQKKWGTPDKPYILTYHSEAHPGRLRLAWEHRATIRPGQTWESGEFWLTPHPGGWAKGIEVFRGYVRRVNPPRDLPLHVRDGLGFRTIWMARLDDPDPTFRFSDLSRVAQEARQYGLNELNVWEWCTDYTLPIPIRPELGSTEDFLMGIQDARRLGVNVAPFVSVHIIHSPGISGYGPGTTADGNWTYHPDLIPQFRPYYVRFPDSYGALIDTSNSHWQRNVLSSLTEWINRGIYSFSFDQFYAEPGKIDGLVNLAQQVRTLARAKNPQSTFSGESFDLEHDGSVLDYTWNWVDYVDAGPILNVLRAPRLNCNIDDSPLAVKECFAEDLYLNVMPSKPDRENASAWISDKPAVAASLKEVSGLRKQFLPYLVNGTFIGDSMLSVPVPAFVRGYQLGKSLLIFVLNTQQEPQHVILQSDLRLWLPSARSFEVKSYDSAGRLLGTAKELRPKLLVSSRSLQPSELAIFEVRAE